MPLSRARGRAERGKSGSGGGKRKMAGAYLTAGRRKTCRMSSEIVPTRPMRRPSARTSAASVSGGKRPPRRRREALIAARFLKTQPYR